MATKSNEMRVRNIYIIGGLGINDVVVVMRQLLRNARNFDISAASHRRIISSSAARMATNERHYPA